MQLRLCACIAETARYSCRESFRPSRVEGGRVCVCEGLAAGNCASEGPVAVWVVDDGLLLIVGEDLADFAVCVAALRE